MNSKNCRVTRREIDRSEVNQRLSDSALAHMAVCLPCREFHAERSRLRELVGSLEPVAAPADFDARLRARIFTEQQTASHVSFFSRFAVSTPAVIAAALVVILAGAVVWFAGNRGQAPTIAAGNSVPADRANAQPDGGPSLPGNETTAPVTTATTPTANTKGVNEPFVNRSGGPSLRVTNRTQPLLVAKGKTQSRDLAVEPAVTIKQTIDQPGEVSFSAPDKPLVVSVQDNHGATRKISLPAVSFGSQRLVDNRVPVSSQGRIW